MHRGGYCTSVKFSPWWNGSFIGKPGATNAAIFAAQIIGSSDAEMRARLDEYKASMASKVAAKDEALRGKVAGA